MIEAGFLLTLALSLEDGPDVTGYLISDICWALSVEDSVLASWYRRQVAVGIGFLRDLLFVFSKMTVKGLEMWLSW